MRMRQSHVVKHRAGIRPRGTERRAAAHASSRRGWNGELAAVSLVSCMISVISCASLLSGIWIAAIPITILVPLSNVARTVRLRSDVERQVVRSIAKSKGDAAILRKGDPILLSNPSFLLFHASNPVHKLTLPLIYRPKRSHVILNISDLSRIEPTLIFRHAGYRRGRWQSTPGVAYAVISWRRRIALQSAEIGFTINCHASRNRCPGGNRVRPFPGPAASTRAACRQSAGGTRRRARSTC